MLFNDPFESLLNAATFGGNKLAPFFGDGRDGVFNSTGDVVWDVKEDSGVIVKQFKSFTLNSGHTLTASHRNRGIIIFAQEFIRVAGIIDQSQKSPIIPSLTSTSVRPHNFPIVIDRLLWPGRSVDSAAKNLIISAGIGGDGGDGGDGGGYRASYQTNSAYGYGGAGGTGSRGTWFGGGYGGGGGGGGNAYVSGLSVNYSALGGNGGDASISSVPGSGGSARTAQSPGAYDGYSGGAGAGGSGGIVLSSSYSQVIRSGKGGKGPGGGGGESAKNGSHGRDGQDGSAFGGGLVVLVAPVINLSGGSIRCNGGPGGDGAEGGLDTTGGGGGGGGGGGIILILYRDTYTSGNLQVNGGSGGAGQYNRTDREAISEKYGRPGKSGKPGTTMIFKI